MSSNFPAILEGIRARFQAVVGVPAYGYDPRSYGTDMHIRFIGASGRQIEGTMGGNSAQMAMEWTLMGRLVVRYVNNETAEILLAAKVPLLISAMRGDLDAGGTIADGWADTDTFTWRYVRVGIGNNAADYRVIDFPVKVVEYFPSPASE